MRRYCSCKEIQGKLQTGDLILAHGTETTSKIIETVEASEWSHVCMVVQGADVNLATQTLILESSDSSNLINVITGEKAVPGPMLVDFEERIKTDHSGHTDSKFALRRLAEPIPRKTIQSLNAVLTETLNYGFPSTINLAKELFEGRFHNKPAPEKTFFCSELISYTLMKMGLISSNYVCNGYTPADFDESNSDKMPWIKRVTFGPQIYFK